MILLKKLTAVPSLMKFSLGLVSLVLVIVTFFAAYIWWDKNLVPSPKTISFTVEKGESLSSIATRLHQQGIVRHRYFFIGYAYFLGLNRKLHAGDFKLNLNSPTSDIILKLATGGSKDYLLTIKPGNRIEEFAPNSDFLSLAKSQEGYLFPDTYSIPQDSTPRQILSIIDQNFVKKTAYLKLDRTKIILASLVEREGRLLETKKMIAGILYNRLQNNMPLQIDATVQYAKDSLKKPEKYWQPILKADLEIKSPYNTYQINGLPPLPICNPGIDSLIAVSNPTSSDYFFYITDPQGQMHYAKTVEEHNSNVSKYLR